MEVTIGTSDEKGNHYFKKIMVSRQCYRKKNKFRYFGSKKEFKLKPILFEVQEKDSHGRGGGFEGIW